MSRQCTLRIINEVECAFLGLEDSTISALKAQYALKTKNHRYHPKFKLGVWDGCINYFQATGRTYNFLIPEIVPILMRGGYKIKVEDLRSNNIIVPPPIDKDYFSHFNHFKTGKPIELRQDQVDAVNSLIAEGNGICLASTGAGKTIMTAAVCDVYGKYNLRTIVIVPDQTLIRQTRETLDSLGLDTGEYSGSEKTQHKQHVVSTWQALQHNPQVVTDFDVVLVDEAHKLRGDILQKLLIKYCKNITYRFGLTGTLPKDPNDKMCVHIATGPIRCEIAAADLMEIGALSRLNINIIQLVEDMQQEYEQYKSELTIVEKPVTYAQFKEEYFPDFSSEQSYLQSNKTRLQWIADYIIALRDKNEKSNTLCLVTSIPLARKLAKMIPNAIVVNGQDTKTADERGAIYKMFDDQDNLIVIATVHIAGTGLSIDRIFNLVYVDIGKAFERVIQGIGRGVRVADDKKHCVVTDICSDLKYSKKHLTFRNQYYKEAKYPHKKHKIEYTKS